MDEPTSTGPAVPADDPLAPLPAARISAAPSRPRERRLRALAEIVICSSVPTQLAIGSLIAFAGWTPRTPDGGLSLRFVVALSVADTALLVLLMVLLTRAHGERVSDLWVGSRPPLREALLGLALVPVVFVIVLLIVNGLRLVAPGLRNVPVNPLEQLARGSAADAAVFALAALVAGGIREELQRAFLLRRFELHLGGAFVGVLVLSVAFGLGHFAQGWDAVIATGTLGVFWAVIYLWRRSSIAPMVSHAGFNSLEVLRVALGGS